MEVVMDFATFTSLPLSSEGQQESATFNHSSMQSCSYAVMQSCTFTVIHNHSFIQPVIRSFNHPSMHSYPPPLSGERQQFLQRPVKVYHVVAVEPGIGLLLLIVKESKFVARVGEEEVEAAYTENIIAARLHGEAPHDQRESRRIEKGRFVETIPEHHRGRVAHETGGAEDVLKESQPL